LLTASKPDGNSIEGARHDGIFCPNRPQHIEQRHSSWTLINCWMVGNPYLIG